MAAAEDEACALTAVGASGAMPGLGSVLGSAVYRSTLRLLDRHVNLPLTTRRSAH